MAAATNRSAVGWARSATNAFVKYCTRAAFASELPAKGGDPGMNFGKSRTLLIAAIVVAQFAIGSTARAQESSPFDPAAFKIGLELLAKGFDRPVLMVDANDGTGRAFVVEQGGTVRLLVDGEILADPFLDISQRVSNDSEQGLLSIALHPEFAANGTFFINYTDTNGNTQVERWSVSTENSNVADPPSAETILTVEQPAPNHNGGLLLFGPDGYLYVGLGDGGNQGDPNGHGQDTNTLLGSILRIDIDNSDNGLAYGIPDDNPFASGDGGLPEIWLYGFRNPWRFSFDRATGDIFIGDVGQGDFEEIDRYPAGSDERNFGWNLMEGSACHATPDCDQSGLVLPIFEYSHDLGCSVTGGYVYRGDEHPSLSGVYFLADYCTGLLWGLGRAENDEWVASEPVETGLNMSSFAEDAGGQLFVLDLNGAIYRVVTGQ